MQSRIVEAATDLFLSNGYGSVTVEAVAGRAGVSKRTFYSRFADKPALFMAVFHALIARWLPPAEAEMADVSGLDGALRALARRALAIALTPEALALHRVIIAEAGRFPELGRLLQGAGVAVGVDVVGSLLRREAERHGLRIDDAAFAAQEFISMVVTGPQRRALGLGPPLDPEGLDRWADRSVDLFLHGLLPRT